jgi:hypothetical protein
MTYFYKKTFILIISIVISGLCFSQSSEIKIRFIGNCGLNLTDGNTNLYIDFPYKSGAHDYMEYDKSELDNIKGNAIFIFTHTHSDHYSKALLKKFNGKKYGPWNISDLEELSKSIPDFTIQSFKTKHNFSFKHYSYLITWHNKKIFISGDTGDSETISAQKDIDWAFIPAWLTLDAKEKDINLGSISKMFAIYHIGPKDKVTNDKNDPQIKLLDKQGEIISIPY